MNAEEYVRDPCGASSLPFWKAESLVIPEGITVCREDRYSPDACPGRDEPYFRLVRGLKGIRRPEIPESFALIPCSAEGFAEHIGRCYTEEGVTAEELRGYAEQPVYDPELWIAVAETETGRIAATGIAGIDRRIGEGILDWVQVSPEYRRKGLGRYIVTELLYRMAGKAGFATVSGRADSPCRPMDLYLACGFRDPVIWHIVRRA